MQYLMQDMFLIYAVSGVVLYLAALAYEQFYAWKTKSQSDAGFASFVYLPLALPVINLFYVLGMPYTWNIAAWVYFYGMDALLFKLEQSLFRHKYVLVQNADLTESEFELKNLTTGVTRKYQSCSFGTDRYLYWVPYEHSMPRLLLDQATAKALQEIRAAAMKK